MSSLLAVSKRAGKILTSPTDFFPESDRRIPVPNQGEGGMGYLPPLRDDDAPRDASSRIIGFVRMAAFG